MPRGKAKPIENATVTASEVHRASTTGRQFRSLSNTLPLQNNTLVAFDGKLAAGMTIESDLPPICAHTFRLTRAMERVGNKHTLAYIDGQLVIANGKFRAIVPTIDGDLIQFVQPDPSMYPIDDDWKVAAVKACTFVNENASEVVSSAIMTLPDQSFVGTNRHVILQVAHRNKFPPFLVIPKMFITALEKVKKPLHRFGFSDTSLTIWFEDGSWLKTQLFSEGYPAEQTQAIVDQLNPAAPVEIPAGFFEGVAAVADFSDNEWTKVYSDEGELRSHKLSDARATTFQCKGVPAGLIVNPAYMKQLEPLVTSVDWDTEARLKGRLYAFFGPYLRAAVTRFIDE